MRQLSLILPVYNQSDIISPVYKQIYHSVKKLTIPFEIILVENGSTDGTEKITTQLSLTYPHTKAIQTSKGYGNAVIAGLNVATGNFVAYMPSDGQIDLSVLPNLWKLAKSNKYQIVKIKRSNRESMLRTLTSKLFSILLALRFGTPIVDINGSPRILKKSDITSLNLSYRDSFIDAEMLIKAKHRNWKIFEIPMKNLDRYGGKSSRSVRTFTEFIHNMITFQPDPPHTL